VLGMNFKDQPSLHWWAGFLVIVAIMVIIAVPMYIFFKKKEWL
jgi:Mg2+ and Co2+ transporter CorA